MSGRSAPKPPWLKKRLPSGEAYESVRNLVRRNRLHTVCQEAHCPNIWECYQKKTATFMIMGDRCTRACGFCAVGHSPQAPPDPDEPIRIARAAATLGLDYLVVTSVTRDDLPDCGAGHFSKVITAIREHCPGTSVEVLIPDFAGDRSALLAVLNAGPDVLNHNIETVPRLYSTVRPQASFRRSLELLATARRHTPHIPTKSGMMLGLGERDEEIRQALEELRSAGCRILTLGQYLQPSARQLPVHRYLTPDEFDTWRDVALAAGFDQVASGPFVRSSYQAKTIYGRLSQPPPK
jgi:lipoic acid synthetase